MNSLNKVCAAFAVSIVLLIGGAPYAIDAAFHTNLVAQLNQNAAKK